MAFFPELPSEKKEQTPHIKEDIANVVLSGERSSMPDYPVIGPDYKARTEIKPDFNIEILSTMEYLAVMNGSFSQGLDNIVQLGNTEHKIEFADKVKDSLQREVAEMLEDAENNWYEFGEGNQSLKGDLLAQTVINGCISAECIPESKKLYGLTNIVRVRPKNIRFVYNPKTTKHDPYQRIGHATPAINGLRELNTNTYAYIALRRYFESPYPTPPFLAALRNLVIKDSMLDNFEKIMKMMGVLGLISVNVKKPPRKSNNESDDQYLDRCFRHLRDRVNPMVKKTMNNGFISGFMGDMEMKATSAGNNAKGANEMMKLIDLTILAGLKQDPNMNGLNFSTTETFGKIIMEKMVSQVGEYQMLCDSFFKKAYRLDLRLKGYDPNIIKRVKSAVPRVRDEKAKAEADQINQNILLKDYTQGLISQQQLANARGYDKPDQEEPRYSVLNDSEEDDPKGKKKPKEDQDDDDEETSVNVSKRLQESVEFDYSVPKECNNKDIYSFAKILSGKKGHTYRQYLKESMQSFKGAVNEVSELVVKRLREYSKLPAKNELADAIYFTILSNWENEYISKQDGITSKYITDLWDQFRRDKSVFNQKPNSFADEFEIPEAVFDMDDFRAIQYFIESDQLYLGKFINDKDTKSKLYKFVLENYVNGNIPIGEEPTEEFRKAFGDLLQGESYKISRIIDTTANRIRNNSAVYYMDQAKVEHYRINEIQDNLTCEWCAYMDGKQYEVAKTKKKLKGIMQSDPRDVATKSPFATSIDIDDFQGMSTSELESAGIDVPVYHPKCRGFVSAML